MTNLFGRVAKAFNVPVTWLLSAPVIGPRLGSQMVTITYVGRRSGKTFSTPVSYRRDGDDVTIGVAMPDAKTWWRNFSGEGAPITLEFDSGDRSGHAVSSKDARGRVSVKVQLTPTP